jgi:hypothetical protein
MANWQTYAADRASKWYSLQPGRWLDEVTHQAVVVETRENPPTATGVHERRLPRSRRGDASIR